MTEPVIAIRGLSFRYRPDLNLVLDGLDLNVPPAARCLLIGANGAGKTTLLRVMGGKHLVPPEVVRVLGRPAFHDTALAGMVEYLGGGFPFEVDLRVGDLVEGVRQAEAARRDRLIALLGVDLEWHMHRVSDGQRRRVQILLGLMRPRQVLLLDEITTDLDLLARQDLLDFLREESEGRSVTIVYATHILDRLESWATHLCAVRAGRVAWMGPLEEMPELARARAAGVASPMYEAVLAWLRNAATLL
ncbi:MAG TPA: ATP-binding cassette domain-containing protein [Kofleriaceae bacterium]|nr:ATP-binding cassette domain-containing protein [Kofleriaceae bacterium]